MTYKNPKQKPATMKRESPQDLVIARNNFIKQHPEHAPLTLKGFALLRNILKGNK